MPRALVDVICEPPRDRSDFPVPGSAHLVAVAVVTRRDCARAALAVPGRFQSRLRIRDAVWDELHQQNARMSVEPTTQIHFFIAPQRPIIQPRSQRFQSPRFCVTHATMSPHHAVAFAVLPAFVDIHCSHVSRICCGLLHIMEPIILPLPTRLDIHPTMSSHQPEGGALAPW